jgi:hypothetical protein
MAGVVIAVADPQLVPQADAGETPADSQRKDKLGGVVCPERKARHAMPVTHTALRNLMSSADNAHYVKLT